MRFYSVGNQYLSSIQQGIQAAHCVSEMFINHDDNEYLWRWAKDYKTLICLNGGNNAKLEDLWDFLNIAGYKNSYPWITFCEDQESMGGMLTSVGIIVPKEIYSIDLSDASTWSSLTPWEVELATRLKQMPTAR